MRIVFLKVSSMRYYKGACPEDVPQNGGSFVNENGYGHEEYNFNPFLLNDSEESMCLGFFEPKSNRGFQNSFHIEKIEGCSAYRNEPFVDDVLVVWCATMDTGRQTVVGWYKHAEVFRYFQDWIMEFADGTEEERFYNVKAKAKDCVLLPFAERNRAAWSVPNAKYTHSYGFGQAMVWYPTEPEAADYLKRLQDSIDKYSGENHLYVYPGTDH